MLGMTSLRTNVRFDPVSTSIVYCVLCIVPSQPQTQRPIYSGSHAHKIQKTLLKRGTENIRLWTLYERGIEDQPARALVIRKSGSQRVFGDFESSWNLV